MLRRLRGVAITPALASGRSWACQLAKTGRRAACHVWLHVMCGCRHDGRGGEGRRAAAHSRTAGGAFTVLSKLPGAAAGAVALAEVIRAIRCARSALHHNPR